MRRPGATADAHRAGAPEKQLLPAAVDRGVHVAVLVEVDHGDVDLAVAVAVDREQVRFAVAVRVDRADVGHAVIVRVDGQKLIVLVAAGLDGIGHDGPLWKIRKEVALSNNLRHGSSSVPPAIRRITGRVQARTATSYPKRPRGPWRIRHGPQ